MSPEWTSRARRGLLSVAAAATFIVLVGATYQGVATAVERRQFPHPGRLVDVGGHQLHIDCAGERSPTVVLEAPAFGMSAAWSLLQPLLGTLTRVCSYDRAGLGWSESGDGPFDAGKVPDELHALLERSRERGPFVLVGHGMGAVFVRLFASRYPGDARALVLIDEPSARPLPVQGTSRWLVTTSPWLARAGVLRVARTFPGPTSDLPTSKGAMRAFLNRPDHLTRAVAEMDRLDDTLRVGSTADLKEGLRVWEITGPDTRGVARLGDPAEVERLTRAISDVVRQTRAASR